MEPDCFLVRARAVVPVSRPPISEGAVFVSSGRILEIGGWNDVSARHPGRDVVDLGDQILLPGLINSHCHLDYTRMAAGIPPQRSFSDWIKAILAFKAAWSYTDFAESWLAGANMLLKYGTTTVLDIEAVPELLSDVWSDTPLRIISALEMTGIRSGKTPREILDETIAAVPEEVFDEKTVALSPHSLYSTQPELVRLAAAESRQHGWLLTTHVAESAEEVEMFVKRSGTMHEWLHAQRDMSDCRGASPVQLLAELGALSGNFLAVHVNYLNSADIDLLAQSGSSVVHCPRSHDYFRHEPFPLADLVRAGVNVCLGTDSLATVRGTNRPNIELDLFKEMRAVAKANPELEPEFVLRMATIHGARALQQTGEIGEISVGARADLIAIPDSEVRADDVYDAILNHEGAVPFVMIGGKRIGVADAG